MTACERKPLGTAEPTRSMKETKIGGKGEDDS